MSPKGDAPDHCAGSQEARSTRPARQEERVSGGYQPRVGQRPVSPPTWVPNQPSSVQPPRK